MEVLVKGMLNKATLLDLIRSFIVFEKDKQIDTKTGLVQIETNKKVAGYHQYYAVNKAMTSTKTAMGILSSPKSASDPSRKADSECEREPRAVCCEQALHARGRV